MSKGSKQRPRFIPLHEYAANYDRTFPDTDPSVPRDTPTQTTTGADDRKTTPIRG